ncbi:hypothetical protein U0070_015837, partial [Myodes glareolus]
MTQLFTMHFFGGIEVFILTGMAYDRYAKMRCNDCRFLCWEISAFLGQFLLAVFLPYCGPNEIDHYFCDVYPLLKLACADTRNIGFLVIANSGLMGLVTFVVLLISYAVIIYTVRSYSAKNRHKALSICSTHLSFFATLPFIYIQPAMTLPENKIFVLFLNYHCPHAQHPDLHTQKQGDEECHQE